jgi:hypothetical protein
MSSTGWTPRIVPYGADQTVYLVIDRFGGLGIVYRETEVERADLETIITDLMSGQFNDPVRIVAFNTLEHWSADVSEDITTEIQTRCGRYRVGSEHQSLEGVGRDRAATPSTTRISGRPRSGIRRHRYRNRIGRRVAAVAIARGRQLGIDAGLPLGHTD